MHSNYLLVVVATMIYDHEWRGAEVRRNFGVLTLSFQMARRTGEPSPLACPASLALPHRRPLDQSTHLTRVHFGPLASAAKMGSHDGVVPWLHRTRRQVSSKYNAELGSPTFRVSSSFSS